MGVGIEIEISESGGVVFGTGFTINDRSTEGAHGDGSLEVAAAADRLVSEMSGVGSDGNPADARGAAFSGGNGEDRFVVADFHKVLTLAGDIREMLGVFRENDGA